MVVRQLGLEGQAGDERNRIGEPRKFELTADRVAAQPPPFEIRDAPFDLCRIELCCHRVSIPEPGGVFPRGSSACWNPPVAGDV